MYSRTDIDLCGRCLADPCLSCGIAWSDDRLWIEEYTVQISSLNSLTRCTGYVEIGACGEESACSIDMPEPRIMVEITLEPCGNGWCPSQVDVPLSRVSSNTCYSPTLAESDLSDTTADELAAAIEQLSWNCPE
jgi:hypothetical protein